MGLLEWLLEGVKTRTRTMVLVAYIEEENQEVPRTQGCSERRMLLFSPSYDGISNIFINGLNNLKDQMQTNIFNRIDALFECSNGNNGSRPQSPLP